MVNTIINTNEVSTIEEVFINPPQEKVHIFGGEDILLVGTVLAWLIALSLMSPASAGGYFTTSATWEALEGVSLSLLQWIFPAQESNWGLLHCR